MAKQRWNGLGEEVLPCSIGLAVLRLGRLKQSRQLALCVTGRVRACIISAYSSIFHRNASITRFVRNERKENTLKPAAEKVVCSFLSRSDRSCVVVTHSGGVGFCVCVQLLLFFKRCGWVGCFFLSFFLSALTVLRGRPRRREGDVNKTVDGVCVRWWFSAASVLLFSFGVFLRTDSSALKMR